MSLRYPILVWEDDEGDCSAVTLSGVHASAIDRTAAGALLQLKRYLRWLGRQQGSLRAPNLQQPAIRIATIPIRPQYQTEEAVYPVPHEYPLRVVCVEGRRDSGTRVCVLPLLGIHLTFQPSDPIDDLVRDAVQRALGNKTPQELARYLPPQKLWLETLHVRADAAGHKTDDFKLETLEALAEPVLGRGARGSVQSAFGRDALATTLAQRLATERASMLLVGESGCGKTTLLHDAVRRARKQLLPVAQASLPVVAAQRFWRTSGARFIAGMKYLGQWEERCEQMIEELRSVEGTLLVDNLLELVRVGGRDPNSSVGAFLLPYLERGELRMVAEATPTELDACRRLLPGLVEQLSLVRVAEFTPGEAREVLDRLLAHVGQQHHISVATDVSDEIYRLFQRFQPYAAFPGPAAVFARKLVDSVSTRRAAQVTAADVYPQFQAQAGLPDFLLRDEIALPHAEVLAHFEQAVLGQPVAARHAAAIVTTLKTGLNDPERPLGVLLFCGPTGVGKTEMAKALARYLFGAGQMKDRLVRLDMSEYAGPGAARRLLLSASGEPSEFIKRVRMQPFSVVLLDEIEKAAPEVHDVLLGVLDEGRLTDRFGRTTSFRSAVILLTSNVGSQRAAVAGFGDDVPPSLEREVLATFRPEFFNRLDAVVTFAPLSPAVIRELAQRELRALAERDGLAKSRLTLTWTDELIGWLAREGCDARYGARPLQRVVEQQVVAPLARWLVAHRDLVDAEVEVRLGGAGVEVAVR